MILRYWLAGAGMALGACAAAPAKNDPPLPPVVESTRSRDEAVVALYNGRPLTWREVAEHVLEADLKQAVDQVVRARILEERKAALGIVNTEAELRRRAEAELRRIKAYMGEDALLTRLAAEGTTEARYVEHLSRSRALDEMLALDKIVRYQALVDDWVEIERVLLPDEGTARRFVRAFREKGFDAAAEEALRESPRPGPLRRVREKFARSFPPLRPPLPPAAVEEIFSLKDGEVSGVQPAGPGGWCVVKLLARAAGRRSPYAEVREEILSGILRDPPARDEYAAWLETEFSKAKVEYADRSASRNQGR